MGSLIFTVLVAGGIALAGLGADISINAAQNWYDTVYLDAFWGAHPDDSPALRALALEEADIDRQLKASDLPPAPPAVPPIAPTRQ